MKIGDYAQIISLQTVGIIEKIDKIRHIFIVKCNNLKISVNESNLKPYKPGVNDSNIQNKKNVKTNSRNSQKCGVSFIKDFVGQKQQNSIDLHKKTVDESIYELEQFIDEAIWLKLDKIKIIHGKGTGVLRREIGKFLKKNKKIKSFRTGFLNEGGSGVTIISL